jgi:1,4-alpha-glucan branching enzyme
MKAIAKGWAYEGEVSPYEKAPFGTPATGVPPEAIIVAKDDHDQIGNTPLGERLGNRIGPRLDRAVDALFGFLPFTVMNFQGDDYRAKQPFDFFVDVSDPLASQIREGRNREWAEWLGAGREFRDPISEKTFEGNQLNLADRKKSPHREAFALSSEIFALRSKHPALKRRDSATYEVVGFEAQRSSMQRRWTPEGDELMALTNMSNEPVELDLTQGVLEPTGAGPAERRAVNGQWKVILNTETARFGGDGSGPKEGTTLDFSASTRVTVPPGTAFYLERTRG